MIRHTIVLAMKAPVSLRGDDGSKTADQYIAEYVRGIASLGGRARARALTASRRRAIARKAALTRWSNVKKVGDEKKSPV